MSSTVIRIYAWNAKVVNSYDVNSGLFKNPGWVGVRVLTGSVFGVSGSRSSIRVVEFGS